MLNPQHPVTRYLQAVGWTQSELARRAQISRSLITRALSGDGHFGRLAAKEISRATAEAFADGVTKVPPLRADELCPKLARKVA